VNQVDQAIYEALTSDAALMAKVTGVYNALAPSSVSTPFVVFQEQAGTDAYTLRRRMLRSLLYQVKCVDRGGSAKTAGEVYDLIDGVLHDASLSVAGYATLYVRRESDVKYTEVVDGVQYWHVGGLYRVIVSPL